MDENYLDIELQGNSLFLLSTVDDNGWIYIRKSVANCKGMCSSVIPRLRSLYFYLHQLISVGQENEEQHFMLQEMKLHDFLYNVCEMS